MSYSTHRYRRGAKRVAGLVATASLVGAGAIATTGVAYAEEDTPVAKLESFDAAEFAEKAAALPNGLQSAIEKDLGISPAEYLANAEAAKSASDLAASLKAQGVGVAGVSIDGQDATLHVESEADVAAAEGLGAEVTVGAPAPGNLDREFIAHDELRGGYGFASEGQFEDDDGVVQDGAFRCSVGFNGYDADGNDRYLTAGHCAVDGLGQEMSDVSHIDIDQPIFGGQGWQSDIAAPIGNYVSGSENHQFGENHDAAIVDVTGDWDGVPEVAGWAGGSGAPDEDTVTIYDSIDAVTGAEACKSGATSGWTCGEILVPQATAGVDGKEVDGFIMSACMLSGDSGGSIVVGPYALGVNSGSTLGEMNCDSWQEDSNWDGEDIGEYAGDLGIGYAVSSGDNNASSFYGDQWELAVEVIAPTIDGGSRSDEATTTTVRGTAGGPNHVLDVEIDDVGTFQPEPAADGSFTIEVDEPLEFGTEYTYTAQASYGQSGSETTEDVFVVTQQVDDLAVSSPGDGQTTSDPQPSFEGTGEPGADVTLTVGDTEYGSTTIDDEGNWVLTPESDLPSGVRFDATITQVAGEDTQEVTVSNLGIELDDVTITVPEDGAEVMGDVVFEGTSFPGAEIGLQIEGTITETDASSDATSFNAASEGFTAAEEDENMGTWEGEFEIDDEGNWTFTPTEALQEGEYTLTAMASLPDGDPELSTSETSVSFTVTTGDGGGGDEEGDEDGGDLPDTGSNNLPMILIGVGLLAAGGTALAIRARRNAASNA